MKQSKRIRQGAYHGVCAAVLTACDSSTTSVPVEADMAEFEVRVSNLTNAQPLSPVALIAHRDGFNAFVDGQAASEGIERMAEGGDNSMLLTEAQDAQQYISSVSTSGPVPPRSQANALTLSVPVDQLDDVQLTMATMLVRTNDAFTAINAMSLVGMAVNQQRVVETPVWDAGTEENTETAATMPGPGFGGEGYNASRLGDIDRVRFHQGVVTSASAISGLVTSDLGEAHRFDNPAAKVVITRVR